MTPNSFLYPVARYAETISDHSYSLSERERKQMDQMFEVGGRIGLA